MFAAFLQTGRVALGPLDALIVPLVNVLQLGAQDAGVHIVQTAVEAKAVDVALVRPVVAQLPDSPVDVGVVRDERATVPKRAEVPLNDEADGCGVAQLANREAVAGGIDRLRVVLDNEQLVGVRGLLDRRHVGALTVKVDGNDRLRLRRDRGFDLCRVDTLRLRIAVNKDGGGSSDPDRFGGGKECVRMRDDLVAGPDAHRHQREPDGIRAVPDTDGMRGSVERGKLLLELLQHRPLDVLATFNHTLDVRVDFRLDVLVLAHVPVETHLHHLSQHHFSSRRVLKPKSVSAFAPVFKAAGATADRSAYVLVFKVMAEAAEDTGQINDHPFLPCPSVSPC